jgi:hypothetical protein
MALALAGSMTDFGDRPLSPKWVLERLCVTFKQTVSVDPGTSPEMLQRLRLFSEFQFAGSGVQEAIDALEAMRAADPMSVIPLGMWAPNAMIHRFVSLEIHHRIKLLLLIAHRRALGGLPRGILLQICFHVCT